MPIGCQDELPLPCEMGSATTAGPVELRGSPGRRLRARVFGVLARRRPVIERYAVDEIGFEPVPSPAPSEHSPNRQSESAADTSARHFDSGFTPATGFANRLGTSSALSHFEVRPVARCGPWQRRVAARQYVAVTVLGRIDGGSRRSITY
jgi:hypothetical protein